MGKKLPPQEMKLYRQTDEILHYKWDPIGVSGIAQARDEYHAYLPQVFKRVLNDSKKEEIAEYLIEVESNSMGLTANKKKALEVATVLIEARKAIINEGF